MQVDASRYEEKSQVTDSDWTNTRQNESLRIFFFEVYISALKQLTTSQPPLLFGNIHLWVISSVSWDTWSPLLLLRALLWANSSPSTACLHCLHSPRSCAMRWATGGRPHIHLGFIRHTLWTVGAQKTPACYWYRGGSSDGKDAGSKDVLGVSFTRTWCSGCSVSLSRLDQPSMIWFLSRFQTCDLAPSFHHFSR